MNNSYKGAKADVERAKGQRPTWNGKRGKGGMAYFLNAAMVRLVRIRRSACGGPHSGVAAGY